MRRFFKDWRFGAVVCLLLLLGFFFSQTLRRDLERLVQDKVQKTLEENLLLELTEVAILGHYKRSDGMHVVSVRLEGELLDLVFQEIGEEWLWRNVVRVQGTELSVGSYLEALRVRNEQEAIDLIKMIQTAQVLAKVRTGRYLPVHMLEEQGYLFTKLEFEKLRGYRVKSDISAITFKVFLLPTEYPRTGIRSFYGDDSLDVRGSDRMGGVAGPNDPVVETARLEQTDRLLGTKQ